MLGTPTPFPLKSSPKPGGRFGAAAAVLILLAGPVLFALTPGFGNAANTPQTRLAVARGVDLAIARYGVDIGAWVYLENQGVLYERKPDRPMPAASAIKTFIALDFLQQRESRLDETFPEIDSLLHHPAFRGFTAGGLAEAARQLSGKSYRYLAEVMMGADGKPVEVYNAACNLLLIDLGGPQAVSRRMHRLSPDFKGLDIHQYMEQWNGHGDNMVTPRSLAGLYLLLSRNAIPGASPEVHDQLRALLDRSAPGEAPVFEKSGTLYPLPMARIRAGYLERPQADLVFALMGTMTNPGRLELPDAFVLLLASMDTLTTIIQEVF